MNQVRVGDVFKAKGTGPRGWKHGTRYWLVVSIRGNSHHLLGLDKDWNIVSTVSYGAHVMASRQRVCTIKNVGQFALTLSTMETVHA